MRKLYVCGNCGYYGRPKEHMKGIEGGLGLWPWGLGAVLDILYDLWQLSTRVRLCPICYSRDMIREDTPRGRDLLVKAGIIDGRSE